MPKGQGRSSEQGVKLLYIRDYLHKYTNKENPKNAKDISEYLASKGIKAERKTIYNDIFRLQVDFQEPIEYNPKKHGYYITELQFSIYDLQILMDCVRTASFLTSEDVTRISKKIVALGSVYDTEKIRSAEWFDDSPVRPVNSEFNNVELIHRAIEENRRISFRRFLYYPIQANRSDNGKLYIPSYNGNDIHVVSPKELVRYEGHYVLICYRTDSKMKSITYPVQFLESIIILSGERECVDVKYVPPEHEQTQEPAIDIKQSPLNKEEMVEMLSNRLNHIRYMLVDIIEKNVQMKFGSKREFAVTLVFKNEDAILILNEFGYDTVLVPMGGRLCSATVRIQIQPQFFNWLFLHRSKVRILSPDRVIDRYCEYVESILLQYETWNMPLNEMLALQECADKSTVGKGAKNPTQLIDEISKRRKSYFKLHKSIKKLMQVDKS